MYHFIFCGVWGQFEKFFVNNFSFLFEKFINFVKGTPFHKQFKTIGTYGASL